MVDGAAGETLMEFANIALTVVLSAIALAVFMVRAIRWTMRNILIEEGLIRPGRRSGDEHWPGNWKNLPDTLQGIYESMHHHQEDG